MIADSFVRGMLHYIPNVRRVGYKHVVTSVVPWTIEDPGPYAEQEVSDEEFTRLRAEFQHGR